MGRQGARLHVAAEKFLDSGLRSSLDFFRVLVFVVVRFHIGFWLRESLSCCVIAVVHCSERGDSFHGEEVGCSFRAGGRVVGNRYG